VPSYNSILPTLLPKARTLTSSGPLINSETVFTKEPNTIWSPKTDCCCHQNWISKSFSNPPTDRVTNFPKPCRMKKLTKRIFCNELKICDECYNRIRELARCLYKKHTLEKERSLVTRERSDNYSNAIIAVSLPI
jgi:hypothetical protein